MIINENNFAREGVFAQSVKYIRYMTTVENFFFPLEHTFKVLLQNK